MPLALYNDSRLCRLVVPLWDLVYSHSPCPRIAQRVLCCCEWDVIASYGSLWTD